MQTRAFKAIGNATTLAATASSQNTPLPSIGNEIRVDNSANAARFLFSTSTDSTTSVASTYQLTVAPNAVEVFYIGNHNRIAYKMSTGTGNADVTRGEGI